MKSVPVSKTWGWTQRNVATWLATVGGFLSLSVRWLGSLVGFVAYTARPKLDPSGNIGYWIQRRAMVNTIKALQVGPRWARSSFSSTPARGIGSGRIQQLIYEINPKLQSCNIRLCVLFVNNKRIVYCNIHQIKIQFLVPLDGAPFHVVIFQHLVSQVCTTHGQRSRISDLFVLRSDMMSLASEKIDLPLLRKPRLRK